MHLMQGIADVSEVSEKVVSVKRLEAAGINRWIDRETETNTYTYTHIDRYIEIHAYMCVCVCVSLMYLFVYYMSPCLMQPL